MNPKAFFVACLVASTTAALPVATFSSSVALAATASTEPLLKPGDQGAAVLKLQNELNAAGFSVGHPDGIYGPGTEQEVKKLQSSHGMKPDGIVGAMTWKSLDEAQGPSASDLHPSSINLNGKLMSAPQAFAWKGTTYMPIYYVMQLLSSMNIVSHWDGTHWTLTVPASLAPDLTQLPINTGSPGDKVISINGVDVIHMPAIVFPDPASGKDTTYTPIWYVMQALTRLQVKNDWNGKDWSLTKAFSYSVFDKTGKPMAGNASYTTEVLAQQAASTIAGATVRDNLGNILYTAPDFTAFAKDKKTVLGDFLTLIDAQNALANTPGGTVKDATGATVYTEPDYVAYTSPVAATEDFTTLAQASAAIRGSSIGYVVDATSNQVVVPPANYEYMNAGLWYSSVSGSLGTPPAFAQVGSKYVSVTTNGQSPQYYLIDGSDGIYQGTLMGSYVNPFETVDLRFPSPTNVTGAQIDTFLTANSSPLQGLGQAFVSAQSTYGVNATYLVSHAILETAWGRSSIAKVKNNLFGYGAYDSNPGSDAGMYPSNEYAIRYEAWVVRRNYLEPTGSFYVTPTLDGMNVNYATDPGWAQHIATIMGQYTASTGGSATQYTTFRAGSVGPTPVVSQAPVFITNGAIGQVMQSAYTNLPVFSDPSVGASQMFPGVLTLNSIGQGVKLVQQALDNLENAGLTVDGGYGPLTQAAVKNWQQAHNLPVTGNCDLATWTSLMPVTSGMYISAGTTVKIDQIRQGMVGNLVTLWFHISAPNGISGWVDAQYISPQVTVNNTTVTNMFRVQPSSGYNVNVYSSESTTAAPVGVAHVGDWVVTPTQYPVAGPLTPDAKGFIPVNWVNQSTGQAVLGYLNASETQLTALVPPPSS